MARDLRGFIEQLEQRGQLRRIQALVDPDFEPDVGLWWPGVIV
jgi:4-hydroxy-3-polyprenylbenzoate decarboxylase